MAFSCTLCGLGPRVTVFLIGTITMVFALLMVGLATTAILAHNCEIDMTESREAYGLYLFYFRSEDCGEIDLRYLGIDVPPQFPQLLVPDTTEAVQRTYVFALVAVALHGALAVTTVLLFGTMCVSCLGRGCVVFGFYPWILAMFLVLALDVTGFVVYLIDFINAMDVDGVLDLLEIQNSEMVRDVFEQIDTIVLVAPSLLMWITFSKGVIFWFMFLIFVFVIISMSMRLWKENKPAPPYNSSQAMQPRQVVHPTSPTPTDLDDSRNESTRYMDQAPQQQMASFQQPPMQHPQIYPVIPPPNQQPQQPQLLPPAGVNMRRTVEPLNDAHEQHQDESPPYQPPAQDANALHTRQTIDPYTDKRFSYLPGQPAPFSYLAGPPPGTSPRSSMNPPPEVRNQLPWSYFAAAGDDKKPGGRHRLTTTLTEQKEFPGEEKQAPTVKVSSLADDRSSVTTDEGKWSGPEYKY
ncbi:uncharacterized protein LOC131214954 [Anopheles bellator]|uniref:uncharacterized protein LOC131214954 n=1 Tax=Anopheles bellator TaxID=139047 RepID=UPI0026485078|nr:uncharacterized protein LOC131214954 [Anopheles bellator]